MRVPPTPRPTAGGQAPSQSTSAPPPRRPGQGRVASRDQILDRLKFGGHGEPDASLRRTAGPRPDTSAASMQRSSPTPPNTASRVGRTPLTQTTNRSAGRQCSSSTKPGATASLSLLHRRSIATRRLRRLVPAYGRPASAWVSRSARPHVVRPPRPLWRHRAAGRGCGGAVPDFMIAPATAPSKWNCPGQLSGRQSASQAHAVERWEGVSRRQRRPGRAIVTIRWLLEQLAPALGTRGRKELRRRTRRIG
jgi:hypothetical protein